MTVPPPRIISPAPETSVVVGVPGGREARPDLHDLGRRLRRSGGARLARLEERCLQLEEHLRQRAEEERAAIEEALAVTRRGLERWIDGTRARVGEILERHLREGRRLGYEEGMRDGRVAGDEEGRRAGAEAGRAEALQLHRKRLEAETARLRDTLERCVDQLEHRGREIFDAAQQDLLRLAVRIAERVIRQELRHDPEILIRKLSRALERFPLHGALTVEAHPDDIALLREHLPELEQRLEGSDRLELVDCGDVERGDCRIRGGETQIDLSVEAQLDIIERRLQEAGGVA